MKVIILGGGTAGWMAAAALAKYFDKALSITLVESDAIGTVGVGEATIPQIRLFNQGLGIDERKFLAETQGTMKLGIRFIDWWRLGHSYFHGFGDVGRAPGLVAFHHYWLRYRAEGGPLGLEAFCANAQAAEQGLYGVSDAARMARLPSAAYHFDAGLYAAFLRRYAEARDVVRLEGKVAQVHQDSTEGRLAELTLEDGRRVTGDFFIDCSGFRALLIGEALGVGYTDWSHWLPCDRALAVPSSGSGRLDPFTRATARPNGWQWQIPLRHRTGNGHVFSSAFTDADTVGQLLLDSVPGKALADPRALHFTTGKRHRIWEKNCVALGLSSGFLEPLESTSIHLIQAGIARLMSLFPSKGQDPALADEFNRQMDFEFTAIRDFLILHYCATERDDTDFWRYVRTMPLPDSLTEKITLFRETGRIVRFNTELFDVPSWLQVFLGQGMRAKSYHPMVDAVAPDVLQSFIADTARQTTEQVSALGPHTAFLDKIVRSAAGGEPAQA